MVVAALVRCSCSTRSEFTMPHASTQPLFAVHVDETARHLTDLLLQPRRTYLKHRAPRSKYVHDLRRKMNMSESTVRPWAMLLAVMFADIEDGVPASLVNAPLYALIAINDEKARERELSRPRGEPSLLTLVQRETDAQCELDKAESFALAEPENPAALDAVIEDAARYEATENALVNYARRVRARLTMARA